ncbi:MAG: mandelate racemase/muconate lactonizing enzyme family protein [Anaerolineae bacterium]|nr:mandelate racemase/muconate lactonizing enzyme family protein [Anaerolineae bacterium]
MKITDVEALPVQAPGRTLVIILVSTDAGITGVGEAGLQRRPQAIVGLVEHLKRWLVGEDPYRIEYLWQRMFRGGFYPGDRLLGSAIAGINIALWDILGQSLNVPVYQLLGGRVRDHVDCFLNTAYLPDDSSADKDMSRLISAGTPEAAAHSAERALAAGQRYFRLAPPTGAGATFDARQAVRALLSQLRAVREAVGDKLELMVDLHTRLSPNEAAWFCAEAEPLNLYVVEDPIRSEHPVAYRWLRQQTRLPLAAGEQWANKWEFQRAIEERWIDYARVDVCIAGGISEACKIAAIAETHLVQMLFHNPLGPICTAASLHLDLALDNAGPQEVLFDPNTLLPDVFECAFTVHGTRLTVPDAPGIGVRVNREAALHYPAVYSEPPHLHRPDGSFTNY